MGLKMNLDKKSLIQIVILIVLIVGGVAAYLMQQEGGLDSITGMFESKPATIRAPTPVASKASPGPQTPADNRTASKTTAPSTPAGPASGQIRGKTFTLENSSIEGGVLTLRSGKEAETLEIKVTLPGSPWEMPTGKNFKVAEIPGADAPRVSLAMKNDASNPSSEQKLAEKFTMSLEFAQEKDGKLPGKIQLSMPDDAQSNVAGSFEAEIKGFRIVDGRPDLTADSVDTLQYLALRELLKDDPNKSLEVVSFRDGRLAPPASPGKNMAGSIEVEYRIGQGVPSTQRFRFEKEAGAWKVVSAQRKKKS